eukprot:PhM_4_TR2400/c0_g1_i1/m.18636
MEPGSTTKKSTVASGTPMSPAAMLMRSPSMNSFYRWSSMSTPAKSTTTNNKSALGVGGAEPVVAPARTVNRKFMSYRTHEDFEATKGRYAQFDQHNPPKDFELVGTHM